jgi:hypothetical protein
MNYTRLLPILMAGVLAACSSSSAPNRGDLAASASTQSETRGDTLSIRLGQSVFADGGRLEIKFDARVNDSRCPANAVCVWQGDAHVRIITRVAGAAAVTSDLHSTLNPLKVSVDRYAISMIGMTPFPGSGRDSEEPVLIVRVAGQ